MGLGHYLNVDPRLVKPFDTIAETGLQARPEKRTMNLQDIRYLIKNDLKDAVDGATHVLRSVNIETVRVDSIKHAQQQCPEESQTDILSGISEETNTIYSGIRSSENTSFSTAGDYGMQTFVSSSASSSQQSAYETSLSSDLEEDTDCESSASDDGWQRASQRLKDGLSSILAHHRSTLDNLLYIQEFLKAGIINPFDEEEKNQTRETVNKCFPHTSTDEVDNIVQQFTSKSHGGRCAVAPPQQFYEPPGIASSSINVVDGEDQKDPTRTSECFGGTRKKALRKNEYCDAYNKFKGQNPQKPVITQIYKYVTSDISGNCKSDDDGLVRKRFDTKRGSTQQLSTISLSGQKEGPHWSIFSSKTVDLSKKFPESKQIDECASYNEREKYLQGSSIVYRQEEKDSTLENLIHIAGRRCPSPVDEESCATLWGIIPSVILSTESNKSFGEDSQEQNSSEHSGSSINTTQERNQTVCCNRETTFEKDMPRVTTLSSSPDSRSIIDVEGLSTIFLDLKSPTKHFTPPKSMEASARHSTPVNQATCSKIKSLPEKKSSETTYWASIESNRSTKSSMTFLSADYDVNSVEQLQEKTTNAQDTTIKNQGLVCIVGSLETSEANNKTDCECQSMDITSLLNETEKNSNCDPSSSKKKNYCK